MHDVILGGNVLFELIAHAHITDSIHKIAELTQRHGMAIKKDSTISCRYLVSKVPGGNSSGHDYCNKCWKRNQNKKKIQRGIFAWNMQEKMKQFQVLPGRGKKQFQVYIKENVGVNG
jgi:hypothetical protein